jgi:hypothetical protein
MSSYISGAEDIVTNNNFGGLHAELIDLSLEEIDNSPPLSR